ncbi:Glycine oxidase [Achromobacter denitrificans]|uniref:FAD-binding oxidoreductase n=2 Tax=Achromobacter denitrificans TaxID=32002 RepID=A0A6J5C1V3_ACHDE|nr:MULTISPECIES: FAD-dependent oxidoreductase [Achromobacter]OLU07283.1 amino acid dehydrogenase [Achromobacter denitrificans]QKH42187.1 FAD-binding oxidoreductase [Achromobacter denitrificans]QKH50669.1 FAD-binding oxidoreductase [Achromobacter denitrificans]QKQ46482.1 FAD-binding oxidoreductase [Achromobacter denitrificans]CAB3722706.1 D-amino acid dehydrogenase 1 [Achromobacter denitrificans]
MGKQVIVLGAGIVGVCCALELSRRGMSVTLVDRQEPGRETSLGNAGVIARSSLMPFNHPGLWGQLPRLLRNDTVQFRYRWRYLAANLGWATRFLLNARPAVFKETVTALDGLIRLSVPEHLRLLDEAGAAHRLRDTGWMLLYRSEQAWNGGELARRTYARHQVPAQALNAAELAELEPALSPIFPRALWIQGSYSVDDPHEVTAAYAELFRRRGGAFVRMDAGEIRRDGPRWTVRGREASASLSADQLVVALGPWSKGLLKTAGIALPLAFERGYHMHYSGLEGASLSRPVHDTGGGYVLSPMARGLRLTTGVELADCEAPARPDQLELAEARAREAFPLDRRLDREAWLGRRPTLPDSRPMIGQAPRHPGLWLALGHQHIGFSTAPGTARVLGELMGEEGGAARHAAFRPGRFL